MSLLKKNFTSGIFVGFMIGITSILILLAGGTYYSLGNPNGRFVQWSKSLAKKVLFNNQTLSQLKTYIHGVKSEVKNPQAFIKSTYSFQKVSFPGSRAESSDSIVTWIAPFSDRIPLTDQPPPEKIHPPGQSRPLGLIGLKGETVSFQLAIRSKKSLDNLTVKLNLDSPDETSCIKIHRFLEIYVKLMIHEGSKYGPLKELINPDPLVPFTDPYLQGHQLISIITTTKDRTQPIWFDVHFSRSCPSKVASGVLELRSNGSLVRKTLIQFKILNATLPHDVGFDRWMDFYITRFWRGELIKDDNEYLSLLHRYYQVADKYGFTTNDCGGNAPIIHWDWNTGKPTFVDWTRYDTVMGPELSGELTGHSPETWCFPIGEYTLGVNSWGGFTTRGSNPSPIENWKGIPDIAAQNLAKIIVQHWKEKGWPIQNGFVYTFDEPNHLLAYSNIYQLIADAATSIHKGSNNQMRFMLTDDPYIWAKVQHGHNKSVIYDKIDIWAPNASSYIPEKVEKAQAEGKRAWFYQSGPPFIASGDLSSRGIGFRMWFWTAWKYNSNGLFYWASNFWQGNYTKAENPYTNGGNGDGEIFYPGHQLHFLGIPDIDGPVPSIRMAQWRRGYEDYKYFVMLKRKSHGNDADKAVNNLIKHALDDGGYTPYWRNPLWEKPGDWNHNPVAWHKERLLLANEIEQLYANH
jgi:hypothetical protein